MPAEIPVPTAQSHLEQRDRILRITDRAHGSVCEVRVDDGIPFVRLTGGGASGQWAEASQASVFAQFASDSPVATFLRTQGANPLRVMLTELGAPDSASSGTDA